MDINFPVAVFKGGKSAPASGQPTAPPPRQAPSRLDGKTKLRIANKMVHRWSDVAVYFDVPVPERMRFEKGYEPRDLLDWLQQRGRLRELPEAFNFLGFDDLLDLTPQNP